MALNKVKKALENEALACVGNLTEVAGSEMLRISFECGEISSHKLSTCIGCMARKISSTLYIRKTTEPSVVFLFLG